MTKCGLLVVGVVTALCAVQAQQPAAPLAFEVASVKQDKSGTGFVQLLGAPGGRFTATNVPLRMLIRNAYQLQDFQVVGGPDWIANDRFDIVAKAEGDAPLQPPGSGPGRMQLMMQTLLADRFKLKAHKETRELPIFALVVARSDGKIGSQLHASVVDCIALAAAARGRSAAPPAPPAPGERPMCGIRMTGGQMSGGGFPLSQLANTLSPFVQRVVVDRTGLSGPFDFDLTWTPDNIQAPPGGGPPLLSGAAVDPNGPSIYTALQEQLGLKLDSQKGPVDVLVIDSVDHPTED